MAKKKQFPIIPSNRIDDIPLFKPSRRGRFNFICSWQSVYGYGRITDFLSGIKS
ncbi:hypothetical protein DMNBHIDG_01421 [Candidatus Methanoperedenaceae archaeon GB37]|nr:hypothetical protein DMNBHIDG_01421 [Candidatus Methanoperedenaceae archaeon GB37]